MGDFKELRVWQNGLDLVVDIYKMTRVGEFAKDFGLKNQIQRASVSIPSNIAEGDERKTTKEAICFFNISKGSAAEVIAQLHLAYRIGYIDKETFDRLEDNTERTRAILKNLIKARMGNSK
ncbi:MAG: four helix bundle protein [Patescibacteria group bacterium]|jgi:four helix bundle protein